MSLTHTDGSKADDFRRANELQDPDQRHLLSMAFDPASGHLCVVSIIADTLLGDPETGA